MFDCPLCNYVNSDEAMQGALGDQVQFRCRMCGAWFSLPAVDVDAALQGVSDDD